MIIPKTQSVITRKQIKRNDQITPSVDIDLCDLYDAEKKRYSNNHIHKMAYKQHYIEINVKYSLEEFLPFARIRLKFKPEKASMVKVIFYHKPRNKFITCMLGLIDTDEQANELIIDGTDDPDGPSLYTTTLKFDTRLIKTLQDDKVNSIKTFMENVPYVCTLHSVKKLIWEEVNESCSLKDRQTSLLKMGTQRVGKAAKAIIIEETDSYGSAMNTSVSPSMQAEYCHEATEEVYMDPDLVRTQSAEPMNLLGYMERNSLSLPD